jgi:hypothetical protein
VTFSSRGYDGLLIEDWPERLVMVLVAVAAWLAYWPVARRARVAGL